MTACAHVDDVVADALRDARWEPVYAVMAALTNIDRYQASTGIQRAADILADTALAMGLPALNIREFDGDGQEQWWRFAAPRAWSVERAVFTAGAGAQRIQLDHRLHPFALATYSAPRRGIWPLRRIDEDALFENAFDLSESVVVLGDVLSRGGTLPRLTQARARAVLLPSYGRTGHRQRVELPAGSALTAFALSRDETAAALLLAESHALVDVDVEISCDAPMCVAELLLPGSTSEEIWVTAHLCHGRPGANDNISGIAASLMLADALNQRAKRMSPLPCSIRFVWGPEYLGTLAALAGARDSRAGMPKAVINLDMVGEDQQLCQSPFVREQVSSTTPSALEWQSDYAVARAFHLTATSPGSWRADPFLGFSDHALCADPAIGVPAVAFCHPEDRYNHTEADTLDKVSRVELGRTVAAAAATAVMQSGATVDPADLENAYRSWAARRLRGAEHIADRHAASGQTRWAGDFMRWTQAQIGRAAGKPAGFIATPVDDTWTSVLRRRWDGPVNLRRLMHDLPQALRQRCEELIRADKREMSLLFNAAIRVDGHATAEQVVTEVSLAAGRPLDPGQRAHVVEVLLESGWVDTQR